ncbi:MAG: hypothetical protein H5T74_06010 [Actinobacteria bacterium]|nr:hypothetical protein [Actinomycetota bacterium]
MDGDKGEVSLKKGKASYRGEDGKKVEVDLEDAVADTQKLVRVGGKWHIDMESFEDQEDFLAGYVKGGSQGGCDRDIGKGMRSHESAQIGIAFDYTRRDGPSTSTPRVLWRPYRPEPRAGQRRPSPPKPLRCGIYPGLPDSLSGPGTGRPKLAIGGDFGDAGRGPGRPDRLLMSGRAVLRIQGHGYHHDFWR